jgi:SAM-dependent methyltransferase
VASAEGPVHLDRERAESFGAVAEQYDRFRPGYPPELIDDLAALRPAHVLDIGCGTGKAARLLSARGLPVLGVEIDPGMAAIARAHGIDVEVERFEAWDPAERRFDLVVSGQAWHWIDPRVGAPKVARLLTPGGTVALFWNYDDLDAPTRAVADAVYREHAPELLDAFRNKPTRQLDDLRAAGVFSSVRTRTYEWERTVSVADWVGVVGTHSDHLMLGPRRLATVQDALRRALEQAGEVVRLRGGTYVIWARP